MPKYKGTAVRISNRIVEFEVEADTAALAHDKMEEMAYDTDFMADGKEVHSEYMIEDLEEVT